MLISGQALDSHGEMASPPIATFNEKLVLVADLPTYDLTVLIRREHDFSYWLILPKGSRKAITIESLMNNIQEVFGKNLKLRQLYKGWKHESHTRNPEARRAARLLVDNHLESIPTLMNNRRMMVDVLATEALL